VRAYSKYLMDGIDPGERRVASDSKFKGVSWSKQASRWKASCKGTYLGVHATEEAAALAYNLEAGCIGRPLNVIAPTGAAGAGPEAGTGPKRAGTGASPERAAPTTTSKKKKRAPPTTPATPAPSKKKKLSDASAGTASRSERSEVGCWGHYKPSKALKNKVCC